jgi:isoamylase
LNDCRKPIDRAAGAAQLLSPEVSAISANYDRSHQTAGSPFPRGANWDGQGVNFSLFSESSESVELCLFDASGNEERRIRIRERTSGAWHIYVPGVGPGQLYGYRVHGPYVPESGLRFNPNKLLLDPYAKAIGRELIWADELFGYQLGDPDGDLSFDDRDSAPFAPLGMVIDLSFDWSGERRPSHPLHETIIYEAHVRGMSHLHPDVPSHLRGTYAGLASEPVVKHLQSLGITALELMPVHYFVHDRHLIDKGLRNYWGYNTLGFFALQPDYASSRQDPRDVIREFKEMVKALHNAGIEVILDVVYNHTAEGNHVGPTLSFRGLDNLAYYRTVPGDPRHYMDYTGTGNTLNMVHPHSLQLLMDSLRYWVTEMHVDGFRFDLASALARELNDVDQLGAFFDTIYQDPTLAPVKLIAEPWDLGEGGYQVGNFPVGWMEWNGKYRDTVRKFWKGDMGLHSDIATRLAGSADLYETTRRPPSASVNFVTAHDGFTLQDLVSYEQKHNEANGENNQDGNNDNISRNWGAEGDSTDPAILDTRYSLMRSFLATLAFSQGVPMISHGDEMARTQRGNNNAYAQDNDITWMNWELDDRRRALLAFARQVFALRHANPVLRRRTFFRGQVVSHAGVKDLTWIKPDGQEMTHDDWGNAEGHSLGMLIHGSATDETDDRGRPIVGDTMLLLFNAGEEPVRFALSAIDLNGDRPGNGGTWSPVLETARQNPAIAEDGSVDVAGHSLALLQFVPEEASEVAAQEPDAAAMTAATSS